MPECPNFHEMASAASNDKNPKQPNYRDEGKIDTLADKINECDGDGIISDRNQKIGHSMQPH